MKNSLESVFSFFHERGDKIIVQMGNMVTTTNDKMFVFVNIMVVITRPKV